MFHQSRSKNADQKPHRSPLSRIFHSESYQTRHRPQPLQTPTTAELSSPSQLHTTPSARCLSGDAAERTSTGSSNIIQMERASLDFDDLPTTSNHAHRSCHQSNTQSRSNLLHLEDRGRMRLAHTLHWTRSAKASSSDSSSTSSVVDVDRKVGNDGLKIKLKIKKIKGQGKHIIHELLGGSRTHATVRINPRDEKDETVHMVHTEPRSTAVAEEHLQEASDVLEISLIQALEINDTDISAGSFVSAEICCPLPVDERAPDSPLLGSSPMLGIDPVEFWSLDGEEEQEQGGNGERERETNATFCNSGLQRELWTSNEVQVSKDRRACSPDIYRSFEVCQSDSALQRICISSLRAYLLSLIKQDTLGTLAVVNIFSSHSSQSKSNSELNLEPRSQLDQPTELCLIEKDASTSANPSLSTISIVGCLQETENEGYSEVELSSTIESLGREALFIELPECRPCNDLCRKCSPSQGDDANNGQAPKVCSRLLITTSVENPSQGSLGESVMSSQLQCREQERSIKYDVSEMHVPSTRSLPTLHAYPAFVLQRRSPPSDSSLSFLSRNQSTEGSKDKKELLCRKRWIKVLMRLLI